MSERLGQSPPAFAAGEFRLGKAKVRYDAPQSANFEVYATYLQSEKMLEGIAASINDEIKLPISRWWQEVGQRRDRVRDVPGHSAAARRAVPERVAADLQRLDPAAHALQEAEKGWWKSRGV